MTADARRRSHRSKKSPILNTWDSGVASQTLARDRPLLRQQGIETALPGDITPLASPMMFHEVARQIFRLEWRRDRGIAVWTSIGANPRSGRDVRFFAERQRPIHFSLPAVVAAFSRRFGRPSEPLIFCRFGAIIFSWIHAFPPAGRGRERAQCLSATDGPDFFLILVVTLNGDDRSQLRAVCARRARRGM